MQRTLRIRTPGRGLIEVTEQVRGVVRQSGVEQGLCNLFLRHTSAGLVISENADAAVRRDLDRYMARAVPDGDALFEHDAEGPDDMPAHVRSILSGVSVSVPVAKAELLLGTWQAIYVWEHRLRGHEREIVVTVAAV